MGRLTVDVQGFVVVTRTYPRVPKQNLEPRLRIVLGRQVHLERLNPPLG
jgi:hypothetical protein